MKLSQLFTGNAHMEEAAKTSQTQLSARSVAEINRQIRALIPGQTISGEVVARNGGEVQIRLAEDLLLNARVDASIHLEQGKNITFEVRNNGKALSLSPLFTNVATDTTLLKALDMAGLPVNETTVSMTKQMMGAGLPVNRNSLQQVYREINSFSPGQVTDVVQLHRLQLPVNEANVQQMSSYRNFTHQLINGLTDILDSLPQVVDGMMAEGNIQEAADLYQAVLRLVQEGDAALSATGQRTDISGISQEQVQGAETQVLQGNSVAQEGVMSGNISGTDVRSQIPQDGRTIQELIAGNTPAEVQEGIIQDNRTIQDSITAENVAGIEVRESVLQGDRTVQEPLTSGNNTGVEARGQIPQDSAMVIPVRNGQVLADNLSQVLQELQLTPQESNYLQEQLQRLDNGEMTKQEFFSVSQEFLKMASGTEEGMKHLQKAFAGREFRSVLAEQLKEQWTLQPEEVSEPGKVEELYRRLDRQLKGLTQALESAGQQDSTAYKAVVNTSQNVDFLNQLNQMYTYVQLPLQLQHSDAHGDLYVYTNKRSLADNDGKVSALLHLDMENLGPLDVYVTLQNTKVNTQFYVVDEEILDFIEAHMEMLTARLQRRGYDCSCSMSTRTEKEPEAAGGLAPLLGEDRGILLSQYAFDVRT